MKEKEIDKVNVNICIPCLHTFLKRKINESYFNITSVGICIVCNKAKDVLNLHELKGVSKKEEEFILKEYHSMGMK